MGSSRHYMAMLGNEEAERVYSKVLNGIEKQLERIAIQTEISSGEFFNKIIYAVEFDHPELYYVDFCKVEMTELFIPGSGNYWVVFPTYSMRPEAREGIAGHIDAMADMVLAKAFNEVVSESCGWSEGAKGRAAESLYWKIYDWLLKNCEPCDFHISSPEMSTIAGALLFRKATCKGYAKTFKYLCDRMAERLDRLRFECIVVTGSLLDVSEGEEPSHSWNAILSESGECFHCDIAREPYLAGNRDEAEYFMITEKEILRDRVMDRLFDEPGTVQPAEVHKKPAVRPIIAINGSVHINGDIHINM